MYEAHLAGFTADASSGSPRSDAARTPGSSRRSRTWSTSASRPSSCCRSSRSIPLAAPPGLTNYWGYQPISFFAPHLRTRARPAADRAPSDEFRDLVKALHRAGHRGHPRRRLQPHRRGRRGRPDVQLPRPRQRGLLPARRRRPLGVRGLQRHRQHVQRQRRDRPPAHPRQPPLLGRGDARRRLPVRPGVGVLA